MSTHLDTSSTPGGEPLFHSMQGSGSSTICRYVVRSCSLEFSSRSRRLLRSSLRHDAPQFTIASTLSGLFSFAFGLLRKWAVS